jgi:uncharacterized membrane protein HdeD (DUF308 family)
MLLAAARRFLGLFVLASAVTAAASLVLGLLLDASPARALSLGFYAIGSFLLIAGFFVGNRGPVRLRSESDGAAMLIPIVGRRRLRWATAEEREEQVNMSAVFVSLGLALIVVGVAVDTRYELF